MRSLPSRLDNFACPDNIFQTANLCLQGYFVPRMPDNVAKFFDFLKVFPEAPLPNPPQGPADNPGYVGTSNELINRAIYS